MWSPRRPSEAGGRIAEVTEDFLWAFSKKCSVSLGKCPRAWLKPSQPSFRCLLSKWPAFFFFNYYYFSLSFSKPTSPGAGRVPQTGRAPRREPQDARGAENPGSVLGRIWGRAGSTSLPSRSAAGWLRRGLRAEEFPRVSCPRSEAVPQPSRRRGKRLCPRLSRSRESRNG